MKKVCSIVVMSIIVMALTFVVSFAATTVTLLDGNISITDNLGNGSGSGTSYTATAKGSMISKKTNNITITASANGKVTFDYSVSSASSFSLDGDEEAPVSGSYSKVVAVGDTIPISITSKSGLSSLTVTLKITNLTWEESTSSIVNVEFDSSLGTVTANGTAVSTGSQTTVEAEGTDFVATPVAGARFIAWLDEGGKVKSWDAAYKQLSDGTETVRALFSMNMPYFMYTDEQSNASYIFDDLDAAVNSGKSKIVLACDGVLPAGDYVIPAGCTLLIPFDAANTLYTTVPGSNNDTYADPKVYRTLTMESGANITVNGAISISAKQSCVQLSNGSPVGGYGLVDMKEGSTITVNNGGSLYVWGYIAGAGKVTAKAGSMVYEDFQVMDWRGGNATIDMIDNDERVFPMSQYYVQNIQVPITLEAGAVENGYMSVYVTLVGIQGSVVPFIGPNGMFDIKSGSITKDYDEESDRLVIDVDGELGMKALSVSMKLSLIGEKTIDSSKYTLPVNGNITLNVNSGSNIYISQEMALLPGGVINVYEGATCTFSSNANAFIYDKDEWGNYCSLYNKMIMPVKYAHARQHTRSETDLVDAEVYVGGTVDAYNGYVYTTKSGANIRGGERGLVKLKTDTETTVTYQATQADTKITTNNEIPITTAKLINADGTYTDPLVLGDCCSAYVYSDGEWIPETVNHTNIVVTDATTATCTQDGLTESSYCSACSTVIKEQTVVPALGHSYGDWIKDDAVNHKKICANDPTHIITEEHTFVDLNCSACGCDKIVTSTQYTISGESIVINTSLVLNVSSDTQIIIATYGSDGSLLNASLSTASSLEEVTLPSAEVAKIRVFAWDGINAMEPVSGVEEILVQ